MQQHGIIARTAAYVKATLLGEGSGHDWWHVYRVWNMAKHIAQKEKGVDTEIVELGALLHDIADWKFHHGDITAGSRVARKWLEKHAYPEEKIQHISNMIEHISFRGAKVPTTMKTKEGMIVQDADRLDAIGAIGIARTFAFGGNKGREIYNPEIEPTLHETFEQYKKNTSHTINHFYEKLLLLKDLMNTNTAKQIATSRHKFMEKFLERFYKEWEGEL